MNIRSLLLLACLLCMAASSAEGGSDPADLAGDQNDTLTASDLNASSSQLPSGNGSLDQAEAEQTAASVEAAGKPATDGEPVAEEVAAGASPMESSEPAMDEMNASTIKSMVLAASANTTSYRLAMDMDFEMVLTPLDPDGADLEILQGRSLAMGAMNVTGRSMKMVMATLVSPLEQWDESVATAVETYFINDSMYTRADGEWTVLKLDDPDVMWSNQDQLAQEADDLNMSEVTLMGVDEVDGQDCYLLSVRPNLTAASNLSDKLLTNITEMTGNATLNLTALMSGMNISYLQWISQESFQPLKTEIVFTITLTPEILGLNKENDSEAVRMDMSVEETLYFKDFNQDIVIVLPEEATKAVPLESASAQAAGTEADGSDLAVAEDAALNKTGQEASQGCIVQVDQSKESEAQPVASV